jgi:hypothetical protein
MKRLLPPILPAAGSRIAPARNAFTTTSYQGRLMNPR